MKMHSIYSKVNSGDAKVFSNEKILGGFPTRKLESSNREFLLNVHNNTSIQITEQIGKCKKFPIIPSFFVDIIYCNFFFSILVITLPVCSGKQKMI